MAASVPGSVVSSFGLVVNKCGGVVGAARVAELSGY